MIVKRQHSTEIWKSNNLSDTVYTSIEFNDYRVMYIL